MTSVLITIKRNELESAIQDLARNPRVILKDLPKDHPLTEAVKLVKLAATILKGNRYSILLDILDKQERPTILIPDSASAFLFGSYQDCYGDVERHCSPLAIGSIERSESDNTTCEAQVWVIRTVGDKKYYSAVTRQDSNQAYVFVDSRFLGFTPHEIELLKKSGVEYVMVLNTEHSRHETLMPMTYLDACPILSTKGSNVELSFDNYPGSSYVTETKDYIVPVENNKSEEPSNNLYIGLAVLVVIIALIVGFFMGRANISNSLSE